MHLDAAHLSHYSPNQKGERRYTARHIIIRQSNRPDRPAPSVIIADLTERTLLDLRAEIHACSAP
jgi:hypothetical protein